MLFFEIIFGEVICYFAIVEKGAVFQVKVLFIASVYRHLTAFHIPYINYFQSNGYEVYVAGAEDEFTKKELFELGCYCIDISFTRSPLKKDNIKAYRSLKRLFSVEHFELVHVHTPVAALLTRMAFRHSLKGKIIYTAHGFHFYKGAPLASWLIYYPLESLAARWTDSLITINFEDYERAKKMGFPKGAVHYVHGVGVQPSHLNESTESKSSLKKALGISDDSVVLSYVAEFNQNKNHQFLLKSWKLIKDQSPTAVLLLIGDGDMRIDIEKFVLEKKLKDVKILGYRNDVDKILKVTDIVSLLSYREGLPKSIMEAMAASIPCVVTDTRGLRDLITNAENGFVVSHGDDAALIDSIVALMIDKGKRLTMGVKARRDVESYRLENVLQEYIAIYDDILGKE